MTTAFDDNARLPEAIEQGAQGGPTFLTNIVSFSGGMEKRNQEWERQRIVYDISYGIQYKVDYEEVLAFFYRMRGRARGFRFKDWSDYQVQAGFVGVSDGVKDTYQLYRYYGEGDDSFARKITRPVYGTLIVYHNGVVYHSDTSPDHHVTLWQPDSGYVVGTFSYIGGYIPVAGVIITASFEFDVPMRFDTDEMAVEIEWELAGAVPSMKLIELKE